MPNYQEIFSHNIGVITPEEQQRLKLARIAVAGVGAIGGNALHILARAGVGNFVIADPDTFSVSNINRQYGAATDTVNRKKVDVLEELVWSINGEASIKKYSKGLTKDNIEAFLDGADAVLDGVDFLAPDIRRELIGVAQRMGIHLFLAPALGFGASVVVFSPEAPRYEDFFGPMPASPSPEDLFECGRKIFPVMPAYVDRDAYVRAMDGKHHIPTFAPSIALASAIEAADVICHILGRREPVCVPRIKWIDLLEQRMEIIEVPML